MYIYDYIEEYVVTKEKSSLMKPSTSTTYRRLTKHLKSFDSTWEANKTDHIKIQQFRLYLIENNLAAATINLMLVRLKTALKHYNQHDGELPEKLFTSSYFQKMKEVKRKRVYITLEELSTIYNMEIDDAKLKKARDLFLMVAIPH